LRASGQLSKVTCSYGSDIHDHALQADGKREVHIIKKEVDVTN
jgi:hypothetical protein